MFRVAITSLLRQNTKNLTSVAKKIPVRVTQRSFGSSGLLYNDLSVTYELGNGESHTVKCKEGENLLDVAINNDLDIDGYGACEGTLACSTCHLIFKTEDFAKIEDIATDEELDMLDLAFGLTDNSRLGCQVCMTKALDNVVVKVPEGVNDQR